MAEDAPTNDVLVAACRRLGEAMSFFDERVCHQLAVNRTDLRALNLLEAGALSAGQIGGRLGLTSGSVTTLVDRLATAGYVTRRTDPEHRRRVIVELTPATYGQLAGVYRPLGERVLDTTRSLTAPQRVLAGAALDRMAEAYETALA